MNDVLNLFTEYDVVGAFWVNIKLTFWSAVIATILGVLLIMMRISPISSLRGFAAGYTGLPLPFHISSELVAADAITN